MSTMLSNKPIIKGLSRNKIMVTGIVVAAVVMIILIYGTTRDDASKKSANDTSNQYTSITNPSQSAENIINSARDKIKKENASQAAINTAQQSNNESIAIQSSPNIQVFNNSTVVPPISNTDEQQTKLQQEQVKNQYKLRHLQNQYAAYASRTLVYSNDIKKINASSGSLDTSSEQSTQNMVANGNPSPQRKPSSTNSGMSGNGNGSEQTKDQNNQADKINFASSSADKTVNGTSSQYLDSKIQNPISSYILTAGSVIPSTMISGLNSDLPGQITAFVRENVYDSATHRILLIPQGAKLIGLYDSNISYGQERILVAWNRLIYPDSSSISLKAMPGTDLEGFAGFYDQVDNHYWKLFGNSFIMGVITGAMQYSQNNTNSNVQSGGVGFTNPNPSVGQTLSGSLGQQLGQTALSMTEKNLNIQPTLSVNPGYPFNVMTTADMVLRPYGNR